jgi:hypothetical protein
MTAICVERLFILHVHCEFMSPEYEPLYEPDHQLPSLYTSSTASCLVRGAAMSLRLPVRDPLYYRGNSSQVLRER